MCARIDCNAANILTEGRFHSFVMKVSGGRAVTLGNNIYSPRELSATNVGDVALAAHELTHVGQFQSWGRARYYSRALGDRATELRGGNPYDWRSTGLTKFSSFGMEQQGQIVQDCFLGSSSACGISPYRPTGGR
jgi:hypothetical protein